MHVQQLLFILYRIMLSSIYAIIQDSQGMWDCRCGLFSFDFMVGCPSYYHPPFFVFLRQQEDMLFIFSSVKVRGDEDVYKLALYATWCDCKSSIIPHSVFILLSSVQYLEVIANFENPSPNPQEGTPTTIDQS